MWYTEDDARKALGLAPVNHFTDALGNVGSVPAARSQLGVVSSGPNWGLIFAAVGVGFAALSYFKGR